MNTCIHTYGFFEGGEHWVQQKFSQGQYVQRIEQYGRHQACIISDFSIISGIPVKFHAPVINGIHHGHKKESLHDIFIWQLPYFLCLIQEKMEGKKENMLAQNKYGVAHTFLDSEKNDSQPSMEKEHVLLQAPTETCLLKWVGKTCIKVGGN